MNETMNTILSRRSIRAYKEDQLKEEELQIPEGFAPYCSAAFGYKAADGSAAPRKEGTVTIIR